MPQEVQVEFKVLDEASKSLGRLEGILGKIEAAEKRVVEAAERAQSPVRQGSSTQLAREEIAAELQKQEIAKEKARILNESRVITREKAASGGSSKTAAGVANFMKGGADIAAGGSSAAMGMIGKAGPYGLAIAAGALAFKAVLSQSTEALNTWNSGVLTSAQKNESLKAQFIPFYESIVKLRQAVDGTTETLARNQRKLELARTVSGAGQSYLSSQLGPTVEANAANRNRLAWKGVQAVGAVNFDRSTAAGEIAYQEQAMRMPARVAQQRANVNRLAAVNQLKDLESNLSDVTAQRRNQEIIARDATKTAYNTINAENLGGTRNKQGVSNAITKAQEEVLKLQNLQRLEAERIAKVQEATKGAVAAERDVRAANLEVMKSEVEVLKAKEARMATAAQRVGSMNVMDREMAKAMALQVDEHLKSGGDIGELPTQMVEAASPYMAQRIAKEREKSGEADLRAFEKDNKGINIGDFAGDTLKEVRDKQFKVETEIRVQAVLDEQKLADAMAEKLSAQLMTFIESLKAKFFADIETFRLGKADQYNSGTP